MAYARVPLVSDLLEFLAGWDLSDGMIDTIDTVEVDRHLSVVAEQRLIGVLLAAMRAGEVEVDRPEVVVEAHERALAHARLLDTAMLESVEILLDVDITPCLLKGPAIARLLPEPDQRISADIDLLVPADRLDAAASALEASGQLGASLRYRSTGSGGSAHRSRSVGGPAPSSTCTAHLRQVRTDIWSISTNSLRRPSPSKLTASMCSPSDPNSIWFMPRCISRSGVSSLGSATSATLRCSSSEPTLMSTG